MELFVIKCAWTFALVVFITTVLTAHAQFNENTLNYELMEEEPADTFIGNLITDGNLDQSYTASTLRLFRFQFLSQDALHQEYFEVEETTGLLRTSKVIDRDSLCYLSATCDISLDITIKPVEYFQIIKVRIRILDQNDNRPSFPEPRIQISISETTVPEATFAIASAQDRDAGSFAVQTYELRSSTDKFELHVVENADGSKDLTLVLKEKLDRETVDFYILTIYATDGGTPSKSGSLQVEIIVIDANDNNPRFENQTYAVSLQENTPVDTTIVQVKASDLDDGENGKIVYSFSETTEEQFGEVFGIDVTSGNVFTRVMLDHEMGSSISLSVVAQDRGPNALAAYAKVIITLKDINDHAPQITINSLTDTGHAEISEMADIGSFVAHISVADPDSGPNGEFSCLLESNDFQLKQMSQKGYKIVTTTRFDREVKDSYEVDIMCQDSGEPQLTSIEHVIINVKDENDHSPEFPRSVYHHRLRENNEVDVLLLNVNASDRDIGANAKMQYSLQSRDGSLGLLSIDSSTGGVFTEGRFDHESKNRYQYLIIARDMGSPPKTATATLSLTITDINDEPPKFRKPSYVFDTFENQRVDTEIGTVTAFDADGPPFNKISYSLDYSQQDAQNFVIDSLTGKITNRRYLDREAKPAYQFLAVAQNPGYSLSGTVEVMVRLGDKNDNAPMIYYPYKNNDTVEIASDLSIGEEVTFVEAKDADVGRNAQLKYQIVEGDPEGVFETNPETGSILVNRELRDYGDKSFHLTLLVEDRGIPQMSAVASLNIYVNSSLAVGLPLGTMLVDSNIVIIVCATLMSFLLVVGLILVVVVWRRRKEQTQRQHKYNCRVEASKMLMAAKDERKAGAAQKRSPQDPENPSRPDVQRQGSFQLRANEHPGLREQVSWPSNIDPYTIQNPQAHSSALHDGSVNNHSPMSTLQMNGGKDALPGRLSVPQLAAHQHGAKSAFHEEPRHHLLYRVGGAEAAPAPSGVTKGWMPGNHSKDPNPLTEVQLQVHDILDMVHNENGSDRDSLTDSGKGPSEEGEATHRASPIDPQFWADNKHPISPSHKLTNRLKAPSTAATTMAERTQGRGQDPHSAKLVCHGNRPRLLASSAVEDECSSSFPRRAAHAPPSCAPPSYSHSSGDVSAAGRPQHPLELPPHRQQPHHHPAHVHQSDCPKHGRSSHLSCDHGHKTHRPPPPPPPPAPPIYPRTPVSHDPSVKNCIQGVVGQYMPLSGSSSGRRTDNESMDAMSDDGTTTSGSYVVDMADVAEADDEEQPQISGDIYV